MKKLTIFLLIAVLSATLMGASRVASTRAKTTAAPAASAGQTAKKTTPAKPAGGAGAPKSNSARAASVAGVKVLFNTKATVTESKADTAILGNPCKEEYWMCMDMFCMSENENGGRCACSNDSIKLDKEYDAIMKKFDAELKKSTATADSIEYGEDVSATGAAEAGEEEAAECEDENDITCKVGAMRQSAAAKICETEVSEECKANFAFTKLQYSQNIKTDCAAYQSAIKSAGEKNALALAEARRVLRDAAAEKLESANKYDESECAAELAKCMNGDDVCGKDWTRCAVDGIADKRFQCEPVLDNCQSVKENVWNSFVVDATAKITSANVLATAETRTNCLGEITDCVANACRDNIAGLGETMDACLARPEMVQSFCKIELEACDSGNGAGLWTFVKQRLAAMRVDKCTEEVKECFTNENACGKDLSNCIGLDADKMYEMCPVDKLVVCKQSNPDFELADLGNMILGLMLKMNDQLSVLCQTVVDDKIAEVCGEEEGVCDAPFQNEKAEYFQANVNWSGITFSDGGLWQACKANNPGASCEDKPKAGMIDVEWSLGQQGQIAADERLKMKGDIETANERIQTAIDMIESDSKVRWCVYGRDMSQINGTGEQTAARFPTLTNQIRQTIARSALKKFSSFKTEAAPDQTSEPAPASETEVVEPAE